MKKKIMILLVTLNIFAISANLIADVVIGPIMSVYTFGDPESPSNPKIDCDGSGQYKCMAEYLM